MARPRAEQNGFLLGPNVLTPIAGSDSPMHAAAAAAEDVSPSKELHSFDANPLQNLDEIGNVPRLFRQLEAESQENGGGVGGPEDGACLEL